MSTHRILWSNQIYMYLKETIRWNCENSIVVASGSMKNVIKLKICSLAQKK